MEEEFSTFSSVTAKKNLDQRKSFDLQSSIEQYLKTRITSTNYDSAIKEVAQKMVRVCLELKDKRDVSKNP